VTAASNRVQRDYRVLPVEIGTGEVLPTLVRNTDWIPVRVATRWAVRRRRFECMPSTLDHDLRALSILYEWADTILHRDLDDMLEQFDLPTGPQLDSLTSFLRLKGSRVVDKAEVKILATVANEAAAIRSFLSWAVDPSNLGSAIPRSNKDIANERAMIAGIFRPLARHAGTAQRIAPLSGVELDRINKMIGPDRDDDGRLVLPLRFSEHNPFRPANRLRNWLMYAIAYQCGLRRGELLKIRLDDVPKLKDVGLKVRRRPYDKSDTRRYKPSVKTAERAITISDEIRVGLRAYLSSRQPIGRVSGRTPYLFVSSDGAPLSITAADGITKIISRHGEISDLSWHSLRHTWAESLAGDLLEKYPEEETLAFLRELGGWKSNSPTPLHYIQNAMARCANEFLRERNSRLYQSAES